MNDPDILVRARSILPLYCFELEPSRYLEDMRKGKKLCRDLVDSNTKVVEFESIGLGIICTRHFSLRNPTKEPFYFCWESARKSDPHLSCYHCHTPNGVIPKGKAIEIIFSFIPQEMGVFEEFYYFQIPAHQIKVTFLMAGIAREPRVYFESMNLDLPPTIVGIAVSKTILIKNEEKEAYNFKFGKMPMKSECISMEPLTGCLIPNQNFPIE